MKVASGAYAMPIGADARADFSRLLNRRDPIAPRIGSILAPIDFSRTGDRLVRDAVDVANLFGARLIGVTRPAELGAAADRVERETAQALERATAARFEILTRPANAPCECVEGQGAFGPALQAWAWSADVVMLAHSGSDPRLSSESQVRDVVRRTRRPVLITSGGEARFSLDHVVVVWSETKASGDALLAALPFLGRAKSVTLLAPPWRRDRPVREKALVAVRRGLLSRNIPHAVARRDHRGLGARIACQVADLAPDLVVAAMPRLWPLHGPGSVPLNVDRLRANLLVVA